MIYFVHNHCLINAFVRVRVIFAAVIHGIVDAWYYSLIRIFFRFIHTSTIVIIKNGLFK